MTDALNRRAFLESVGAVAASTFRFKGQVEASQRDDFQPLYQFAELERYRMYFDPSMRTDLW
jgi:hypothetical protein